MTLKKCTKCGRELPLEAFSKSSSGKYGVISRCKECVRKENKHYYHDKLLKDRDMAKRQRERRIATEEREKQLSTLRDCEIFGNMRIYILNTTGEYSVLNVKNAEVFRTSDKKEFINYLTSLI